MAVWPSMQDVFVGLITKRGWASCRSTKTSCIWYSWGRCLRNELKLAMRPMAGFGSGQSTLKKFLMKSKLLVPRRLTYRCRTESRILWYRELGIRPSMLSASSNSPRSHGCSRHSWADMRASGCLHSKCLMKSFAVSEMSRKPWASKSQSPLRIFFNVSWSLSPPNGDRPLNLKIVEWLI